VPLIVHFGDGYFISEISYRCVVAADLATLDRTTILKSMNRERGGKRGDEGIIPIGITVLLKSTK